MNLTQKTMNNISDLLEREIGMTYEEFDKLNFDEQQKILSEHRKKLKKKSDEYVDVMVGYGEHSTFVKVKKGEKVMTRYGNIIEAGLTLEEEQQRLEDSLDDIIYSKPVAFVKKLQRRINKNKI